MVENSQILVGIGGGEIARDELIEAKRLGKKGPFHSGGHESSKSS